MNGKELLERAVSTIQEMYLKLGGPEGAVSLYYPFEGDPRRIEEEFGTVTFHRFSREEYLALGFALPRNDVRFN